MSTVSQLVHMIAYETKYTHCDMVFIWDNVYRLWYGGEMIRGVSFDFYYYVTDDYGDLVRVTDDKVVDR